jgi:hypothetical protein
LLNPSLLAAFSLVSVLVWLLSRRRPPALLASTDASAVAALNRVQISLVRERPNAPPPPEQTAAAANPTAPPALPAPGDGRSSSLLLLRLRRQLHGDNAERLAAVIQAVAWGDRRTLPLLQRGLRDVDPAVVRVAARGMAAFRGRSTPGVAEAPAAAAPAALQLVHGSFSGSPLADLSLPTLPLTGLPLPANAANGAANGAPSGAGPDQPAGAG